MSSIEEQIAEVRKKYPNLNFIIPQQHMTTTNHKASSTTQPHSPVNSGNPTTVTTSTKEEKITNKASHIFDSIEIRPGYELSNFIGTIIMEIPKSNMAFPAQYGLFPGTMYTLQRVTFDNDVIQFTFTTTQEATVPSEDAAIIMKQCTAAPMLEIVSKKSISNMAFNSIMATMNPEFWKQCISVIIKGDWIKPHIQALINKVPNNIKSLIMRCFTVTQSFELQCVLTENLKELSYLNFDCRCTSTKDIVQNINILCGHKRNNTAYERIYLNVEGYPFIKHEGNASLTNRMAKLIQELCNITTPTSNITILTEEHVDDDIHQNLWDNNFTYVGTIQAKQPLSPFNMATYHIYEYDGERCFTFGLLARK